MVSPLNIAVIFHRFGPYHQARLNAVARLCKVLAIEESAHTSEYAWDEVSSPEESFQRVTLIRQKDTFLRRPAKEIARRAYEVLQQHRPDAVAIPGWSDPAALAALSWCLANGTPCIVMSESTAFDEPRSRWKEWVKSKVVRLCAAGFVGGTPHAEYLHVLGLPRERILLGYDAVDNEHFFSGAQVARQNQQSERVRLNLPQRYFLASSRFVAQKNLPLLLESFANYYRKAGENAWKLVLLGDGPLRTELVELRRSLELTTAVLFPGFKQYDELPAYYGLADAFVHASTREPWGLVINEAMAAGLPVIVSNRCGCAHDLIAAGENGFVFDPTDRAALTNHITNVASASNELRSKMSAESRRIVEKWSSSHFATNLLRAADVSWSHPKKKGRWFDRLLIRALLIRAEGQARRLLPIPT